ncbi:cellulase family glycosylhydrolase [Lacinutrix sp. C3R15]|uniref:glycoside hydrolase family 2 TIM barrel-domain containing protein n=1 Tax=Flavobacteriaceae TaxID=49546 RepID=UPI001C09840B|nr:MULTISPECIES: glycoside hydrolase family 2 TIM barrel-domain containing protein [Flavobacteriaceae]MBU2938181.1 cellulase family glycosylhydrolase [Lacinutrix sp. C3R15]MDO6621495.1 cellulase family glycosylhydrolase [Oceanihabitans sp. 1_MG-2023]
MVGLNKKILRTILISSYIMIVALIISGISALFSYLNTGADRSTMLHTEIQKIEQYAPKLIWEPLNNEGRPMDNENLNALQNDYLDAWYVKQVAYKTNKTAGIKDYYTDSARENLYAFIALNKAENTTIEATTLNHNPTLEFFSEDGQLAVVTDKDVVEYKRIFKAEKLVLETTETSTYKMVFLLEDGFWRIRHLVKESSKPFKPKTTKIETDSLIIKGINYYPKATPWNMFGDAFAKDIIANDFKIIKDAGLNSVRIFVQYDDFGKAAVNPKKLDKLKQTLDAAEEQNLKVVLTLFDFYGDYSVMNWTLNQRHAETIVSTFKDHNAIIAWDIKNEPNLDFDSRGKENVIAWLDNMIDLVKSVDTVHPVTIGWSNTQSAAILKDKVDMVSFHYYEALEHLDAAIKTMKTQIPDKPLVLQEFGISSYGGFWKPFGSSEEDQANYHKKIQEIIAANKLQFMSWTLYDFVDVPKAVVGSRPWRRNTQKHFGFIDKNGTKKASFKYISN